MSLNICGAYTNKLKPCQRKVTVPGSQCHYHITDEEQKTLIKKLWEKMDEEKELAELEKQRKRSTKKTTKKLPKTTTGRKRSPVRKYVRPSKKTESQ